MDEDTRPRQSQAPLDSGSGRALDPLLARAEEAHRVATEARIVASGVRDTLARHRSDVRSGTDVFKAALKTLEATSRRYVGVLDNPTLPPGASVGAAKFVARFTHAVSEDAAPSGALSTLADAAIDHLCADGAVVFAVTDDGHTRVVEFRRVPERVQGLTLELDSTGSELANRVLEATGGTLPQAHVLPIGVFGVLVLLFKSPAGIDARRMELAQGVVDLAAIAMSKAAQFRALEQAYLDLRAMRETLSSTERLRVLGQMAAGIAHDVKNVFQPLLIDASMLKRATDLEAVATLADRIDRVLRRGIDTVERLRRFSCQSPEKDSVVADLPKLVHEAIELAQARTWGRPVVELDAELGAVPPVRLNPSDFVAALVNLVLNGIDAQPKGGLVTLRGGETPSGDAWIEVADKGSGIPPEVQGRIFEPFFTTKGEGTGLGLANVYAFVQRHRGSITFETSDKGTTFRLCLPVEACVVASPAAGEPQ
jgi:signal transduction histidine kinase